MNQPENSEPTPEAPQNPQPNPSLPPRGQPRRPARPHPVAVRLLAVRLHLDEGYRQAEVARQLGVQKNSVSNWVQRYRLHGEAGLQDHLPGPPAGVLKLPAAVREQVLALKRQQPHFGVKKLVLNVVEPVATSRPPASRLVLATSSSKPNTPRRRATAVVLSATEATVTRTLEVLLSNTTSRGFCEPHS